MPPISGARARSGVTISSADAGVGEELGRPSGPDGRRCRRRAAPRAPGFTPPLRMSQEVVASSSPSSRNEVFGRPPVAITTTSGASASTSSASAKTLQRISTPRRSHSATRQSTMPMISRRRARRGGEAHLPAGLGAPPRSSDHAVAAFGRDPRRLEPGRGRRRPPRPCARPGRARDHVRHRRARGRWRRCGCTAPRRLVDASRCSSPCRRRGGCASPRRAGSCATMCGSAMCARVMPTMSSLPLAIAWRAVATSWMRARVEAWQPMRPRTSPAKSRCGAERRAHAGDDVAEAFVGVDVAADHVDEVDHARWRPAAARSRGPLRASRPAGAVLVADHARRRR